MEKHTIKNDPLREKSLNLAIRKVKLNQHLTSKKYESIYKDTEEIMRLLTSSILTKKKRLATKTISALIIMTLIAFTIF